MATNWMPITTDSETLTEMQVRIAREQQAADPIHAAYWREMERKAQAPAVVRAGRGE